MHGISSSEEYSEYDSEDEVEKIIRNENHEYLIGEIDKMAARK